MIDEPAVMPTSPNTVTIFPWQEMRNADPTASYAVAPSGSANDGGVRGDRDEMNTKYIYTHLLRRCKSRARRPGAAAGAQAAWRGGPTEGDDRAGERTP